MAEKKEPKSKKIEGDNNNKTDEELTYEQKSKQASLKLKNITSLMKDFKSIIDEYKQQTKHNKLDKNWLANFLFTKYIVELLGK